MSTVFADPPVVAIVGPTASGKTRWAVEIARAFGGEIISADSRQVYRGMDLGTGKDLEEYGDIPYHLIDICQPGEKYNLHRFLQDYNRVLEEIRTKGKLPVVCGGSGMYVEAALNGLQMPEVPRNEELRDRFRGKTLEELTSLLATKKALHNTTDVDTVQRALRALEIMEYYETHPQETERTKPSMEKSAIVLGTDIPRDLRRERITRRLKTRLDNGMVDEVKGLLEKGVNEEDLIYYGLEYKWLTLYATGKINYQEMFTSLETAIHQFAKRQMTWFRGMEKRGWTIHWMTWDLPVPQLIEETGKLLSK